MHDSYGSIPTCETFTIATHMTDHSARRTDKNEAREHWNSVYNRIAEIEGSWYQPELTRSLELLASVGVDPGSAIIDIGGGDSTLVDSLVARQMRCVTVLDISGVALERARTRLGAGASGVNWIEADVRTASLPPHAYDFWHDRAVFHFLTQRVDRLHYVEMASRSIKPGGIMILATFALDGPKRCSGLPVQRYSADTLCDEMGNEFELIRALTEEHRTPRGGLQQFLYAVFRHSKPRDNQF